MIFPATPTSCPSYPNVVSPIPFPEKKDEQGQWLWNLYYTEPGIFTPPDRYEVKRRAS